MKNIFVAAILLFALGGAFAQTKKSHFEAGDRYNATEVADGW